ncbi:MAG: signal peptidase I [Maricaulaceae bacterium]|jgi:signal peptidase I
MTDNSHASEQAADDAKAKFRHEAVEFVRFILGAAVVFYLITTVFFRTFYIPSGSMVPTLEVEDRVIVLNFAYGWSRHSLQFGLGGYLPEGDGRILGRMPKRGHVVVFRNPSRREHLIKRVIGLPGDVIETRDGRLYVNNELVPRDFRERLSYRTHEGVVTTVDRYDETLPGGVTHAIYEESDQGSYDDRGPYLVPPGHIFVMGDNRDRSADSRAPSLGPVPTEYLVGRAVTVLFTFHNCRPEPNLECPTGRLWRGL